jgi:hypothetical protein
MTGYFSKDLVDRLPVPPGERVRGVTVLTAQWATSQANEDGRQAAELSFALNREKYLGNLQPIRSLILAKRGRHTQPCSCTNRSNR